jgi:hypothetical protein
MQKKTMKKGRDPLTKRFTNGHKCFTAMQSQFMVEIMAKDEGQRLHFEDNKYVLQKPRDPVACELTARDNAPFLVKYEAKPEMEQAQQETKAAVTGIVQDSALQGTKQMLRVVSEMARCESLKARKKLIEEELAMVNTVLDHKRVCSYSGFTGTGAESSPTSAVMANSRTRERRPF